MIIHGEALISEDILEKNFLCNLQACKGACCVEGEFGAPLEESEIQILEKELPAIKPFLTEKAVKAIGEKGIWEKDRDGDLVTTCLPTGECNFSFYNEEGIIKCGIEEAYHNGKTSFQKPISCHLYPIRVTKVGGYEALNYHKWEICAPACSFGAQHKMPLYRFLKTSLVRKFGADWYNELEAIASSLKESNNKPF